MAVHTVSGSQPQGVLAYTVATSETPRRQRPARRRCTRVRPNDAEDTEEFPSASTLAPAKAAHEPTTRTVGPTTRRRVGPYGAGPTPPQRPPEVRAPTQLGRSGAA